jgi:hypothetical protein
MAYRLAFCLQPGALLSLSSLAQFRSGFGNYTDNYSWRPYWHVRSRSEALRLDGAENGLGCTFDKGVKSNGFRR